MPPGRKSKLTPERQEKIVQALASGNYLQVAARYAGIHPNTLNDWLDRGRREQARIDDDQEPSEAEATYLELFQKVEQARAQAEVRSLALIQRAANDGTWQAAAWYLERSFPARWGRKQQHEVTGPEGTPVQVETHVSTGDLEEKVSTILAQIGVTAEADEADGDGE